ncbi:uncharacterized protein KQ657_001800 [Scheffersomyces spartinae]|uniref:U1-type domain-containing protein n=1 Tax=Scheffersomyces spartinae TaxID=45513 RepID=A0A9P8AH32_9ASCO|nr:uncharacterized protein KQ657_001800 [Scheffersomyces spartinae]KAG7192401.1 hypothetical protein KQ657_001800 [Scheffersomyces spartinae]
MDYSDRVNSKQGSGGVADTSETKVHVRKRIQELLATKVLDLDNDPYALRNHLGLLECRLCLTTHVSESSYIAHLGGRKHQMNLEKRKVLDEKYQRANGINTGTDGSGNIAEDNDRISISNIEKRSWDKIGKPGYKVTKLRDPELLRLGLLWDIELPLITVEEPSFVIMSYYELTIKNKNIMKSFLDTTEGFDPAEFNPENCQYLVVSGEPYSNICFIIPGDLPLDRPEDPQQMNTNFWWYWDKDTRHYYIQVLFGNK